MKGGREKRNNMKRELETGGMGGSSVVRDGVNRGKETG